MVRLKRFAIIFALIAAILGLAFCGIGIYLAVVTGWAGLLTLVNGFSCLANAAAVYKITKYLE